MIYFFSEDTAFTPNGKRKLRSWIQQVISAEGKSAGDINYVFCSDAYLHQLNLQYLHHDTLTDIITFDQSEQEEVSGDIFISIDRIRENARLNQVPVREELHRVIIHGILHLIGYKDKSPKEKQIMRKKEDVSLSLRNNLE